MPDSQVETRPGGLRLAIDGEVATVTLGRPERRNAMTPAMWHGLADIGASLPPQVRIVVVRGDGPSFCAGIDLNLLTGTGAGADELIASPNDHDFDQKVAGYQAGYLWLRDPSLVSIAAVRGHAIGAGFQLALACDLRVLTEDAQFTMAEIALGLVPDLGGTKRLVELVGYARAMDICLTGRRIGAAEADRLGLATSVVPGDGLDAAVAALTGQLLAAPRAAVIE